MFRRYTVVQHRRLLILNTHPQLAETMDVNSRVRILHMGSSTYVFFPSPKICIKDQAHLPEPRARWPFPQQSLEYLRGSSNATVLELTSPPSPGTPDPHVSISGHSKQLIFCYLSLNAEVSVEPTLPLTLLNGRAVLAHPQFMDPQCKCPSIHFVTFIFRNV